MIDIDHLKYLANENRKRIINMIYEAKSGHEGGSLSIIDMLTAIYEIDVNFAEEQRSKVVLSKGHTVPALYAVLNSKGIIKDEEMKTLRFIGMAVIAVIMSVNFMACSDDDDEDEEVEYVIEKYSEIVKEYI